MAKLPISSCNRRSWLLIIMLLISAVMLITPGIARVVISSKDQFLGINDHVVNNVDRQYRTGYHFQPPKNWMNDPNAPMIYKGVYHLFYQQYPYAPVWNTEIQWGHSTSTDLVNWTPQPIALTPSTPFDVKGCWSGSATILPGNKPTILYTGIDSNLYQVQNLALPKDISDSYLKEWVKVPQNPVMSGTHSSHINASDFRDPSTAWRLSDGKWRVIAGTQDNRRGLAVLFTSENFISWKVEHPLHSVEETGVWECPDFFPVYVGKALGADTSVVGSDVRHVLKISLFDTKYEYYTIGTYDTEKDIYVPDEGSVHSDLGLRYDYGKFYASKSFFDDSTGSRILWGWVNESSIEADDIRKGWSGVQAVPRTIVLDKSGKQLVTWPIKEIEKLRANQVDLPPRVLGGGSRVKVPKITASQVDVQVSFKITNFRTAEKINSTTTNAQILCSRKGASVKGGLGPFGLLTLASSNLEEYTAVFFRIFKRTDKYVVLMCSDQSRSSLNPTTDKLNFGTFVDINPVKDEISLRVLIDHSIVESFGAEGKSCITARVYPTLAVGEKAKLFAFNNGNEDVKITKLTAWSMNKAVLDLGEKTMVHKIKEQGNFDF